MLRYTATGLALKCFSASAATRAMYRHIGNRLGNRSRRLGVMPAFYADRLKRMLRLSREVGFVRDGDRILELGTGWMHWEAFALRLFYDVQGVLYDVWDNRQLEGMKNYFGQLAPMLEDGFGLSEEQIVRARGRIRQIQEARSFEELYEIFGFEYVVEPSGSLERFQDGSFDVVVSAGVLEHVDRAAIPNLLAGLRRVLKPGGWAVHSIDTSDHLSHYDASVNKKYYLGYSETRWKVLCENVVQYINRVQRGEWLEYFQQSGLELVEEDSRRVDISAVKIAERYRSMDLDDLACTVLRVVLRNAPRHP